MTSKILRLSDVIKLTGLSASSIYQKNKVGGEYHDASFPQRFNLSGARAVGWDEEALKAWMAKQVATAGTQKPREAPKGRVGRPRKIPSSNAVLNAAGQAKPKRKPIEKTFGQIVIEGSDLVAHIAHYLRLSAWTPVMGILLAHGIAPEEGLSSFPTEFPLKGLDDKSIGAFDSRVRGAKDFLELWQGWIDDGEVIPTSFTPTDFLIYCWDWQIETPWLHLINEVNGSGEKTDNPLVRAQIALLTSR
jgi:predicted DNA-binding transcriptional regulator AlpA